MGNIDYRNKLEQVLEMLNNAEELNMCNYNHELVKQLNDTFIEVYLFVESALAENTPTSSEQCAAPAVVGRSGQLPCGDCNNYAEYDGGIKYCSVCGTKLS
jgi:hypothetical protein